MTRFFDLFAIFPAEKTPSKFSEETVFTLPSFEIKGAPYTYFLSPEASNAFK
jgi:hypothetical protein